MVLFDAIGSAVSGVLLSPPVALGLGSTAASFGACENESQSGTHLRNILKVEKEEDVEAAAAVEAAGAGGEPSTDFMGDVAL